MPNLSNGKTLIGYTGAATTYTAVADGEVAVKLWGGGGGGTASSINNGIAGAGGFTTLAIKVVAGDVIKIEVGQGGQPGVFTSGAQGTYTGTGGLGGWPDGGNGGANIQALNGGGGGSTRVYKNNVLVGVAGAGGGCGFQTTSRQSGAGGGTVGQDGTQTLDATGGNVSGATQTAGGVNSAFPASAAPFYTGASLQGGHGYNSTQTRSTNGTDVTGAGGGGGFFGGGGAGKAGYQQGASGGSGYLAAGFNGTTTGGNRGVPAGNTDRDYTSGIGVGGTNTSTLAPIAGGNGQAVLDFAPLVGNLSTAGKTTVLYQNPNGVGYNVTKTGRVVVKLWGGGGGGLYLPTVASPGGAGGYTTVAFNVTAGDFIRVEVGQGGQVGSIDNPAAAQGSWVGTGGVGGWPDGGNGASNQNAMCAGGGGSTRIYINGVLQAVAGAGGGAGATAANRQAGAGGGTTGQDGTQTLDATSGNVSGATQSAGGVNSSFPASAAPFYTGGPFQGGHGYATGQTNATDNVDAGGSGGGGGWFGGGGAGKPASYVQGASGGSGFIKAGLVGTTTQGNRGVPANSTDADLPVGKAVGGTNNTPKSPLPGGDGVVVIDFNDLTSIVSGQTFTVPYTGAAETYTVQADGVITFEAWGGGGAGGTFFSTTTVVGRFGGPGSYVLLKVPVKAGDVIKMEAAQGGQKGLASADTGPATAGGLGGWPDGGSAGLSSLYATKPAFGGGGGSTRIYKNGVLVGLAAGGAGSYGFQSGNPGGTLDAPLVNISNAALTAATQYVGGTSTANGGGTSRNFGQGQSFVTSPTATGGNGFANSANNTTATAGAGPGAGGGYWGGGVYYINNDTGMAGGGSSYIHPDYFFGSNWLSTTGAAAAPAGIGTNRPTGVGDGGAVTTQTTLAGVTAGGNGAIWMQHTPNVSAGALPNAINLGVERVRRSFTADRSGTLTAKLWGGAGAGGTYFATTAATRKGGAGGYTEVQIPVVAGDVISVEVGQGGQKPWSSLGSVDGANSGLSTTSKPMYPGAGGWPDGGTGGRHGAAPWGGFGGGGGSTRIYKNGVLAAIAAGGGGSTGLFFGGSGGATVGGQSADSSFCGTGGTQSAGGTSDGASLKGAPGSVTDASAIETTSGAGGGGGYFGGGSNNGRTAGGYGSGGGGSAYMNPSLTASTTSGARDTGIPYDGTNGVRPTGVAVGGSVSTAANTTAALAAMTAGGDGAALLSFPQPLTDGVPITVPYAGVANSFVVGADGVLNLEAWGGAGGGGPLTTVNFTSPGGAGGNINGSLNVFKGDVIKVEVGQGGRKGVLTVTGGLGGWPDGGPGGKQDGNTVACAGGGVRPAST
jgi:hypothetical protein